MSEPRSSTETIILALRTLANDIQSGDGVANACCAEAADRLEEYHKALMEIVTTQNSTENWRHEDPVIHAMMKIFDTAADIAREAINGTE